MGNSIDPELIVFAWGNESRGDDGIGPWLARRLIALDRPGLVVIEDHQLNIEHVMDFAGSTPLLFIDASVSIEAGIRLERIEASSDGNFSTHAISPQALLNVYRETSGTEPPRSYLLHVAGDSFGLGESLGDKGRAAAESAWAFLKELLDAPPAKWRQRLSAAVA
ncbi:MAG: hydrogenase maturation protease [Woeseiaceae bacterium]|nr:hydrogenase maturation protease [Woeseiaceae bacterium]